MTTEAAAPLVTHRRHPGRRRAPARDRDPDAARRRSGRPSDRRFLKAECLQPIGAFKIRGAYVAVASLPPEERARGVITYSSGNHAQGVARAARLLGAPAVVVMPSRRAGDQARPRRGRRRRDRRRRDRQRRAPAGRRGDRRASAAWRSSRRTTTTGSSPARARSGSRSPRTCRTSPSVLVPIGGGGLASGVAAAIKALRPGRAGHRRRAGARRRRARVAASAARSSRWPAELRVADDRRRHADAGARAADVRAPARATSTAIVTVSARPRSPPASGWPPNGAGSSSSHRARWPSRRIAFHAGESSGSIALDGPVVAVVSGGNVDPERYRALPRRAAPRG